MFNRKYNSLSNRHKALVERVNELEGREVIRKDNFKAFNRIRLDKPVLWSVKNGEERYVIEYLTWRITYDGDLRINMLTTSHNQDTYKLKKDAEEKMTELNMEARLPDMAILV